MRNYKLHFIRHGLTLGNLEGRYIGGGTDEPLCEKGKQDIEHLKENFKYPAVEKIYTSPMQRALDTCKILYPNCEYEVVDAITECDFGEFENQGLEELSKLERFSLWISGKENFTPDGGETNQEFAQRCANGLDEIFMDMMQNQIYEAVCVCHGGVIAALLGLFSYPQKPFHEWTSDAGCGYTVITSTEMWTRDNAMEAIEIVPTGWGMPALKEKED